MRNLILSSVKVGQLVLAKKDDEVDNEVWQRAAVVSKEGAACIQISYIDFPGEDILGVKSLRNVDEDLANYPALMTVSPIYAVLESGISLALEYVDHLIQDKAKLRLISNLRMGVYCQKKYLILTKDLQWSFLN
nr:unnamed protein product [Callosobruchus analis]